MTATTDTTTPTGYSPAALEAKLTGTPVLAWMLTDADRAAPLWILATLGRDARIWDHVTDCWIDFDAILAEPGWTGTEHALLTAAASLGGQPVFADLEDLATRLDQTRWTALLEALTIRRGRHEGR
jgi:hypothetical protein